MSPAQGVPPDPPIPASVCSQVLPWPTRRGPGMSGGNRRGNPAPRSVWAGWGDAQLTQPLSCLQQGSPGDGSWGATRPSPT